MVWVFVLRHIAKPVRTTAGGLHAFGGVSVRRSKGRVSDKVGHYLRGRSIDAALNVQRSIDACRISVSTSGNAPRGGLMSTMRRRTPRLHAEPSRPGSQFDLNRVCRRRDKVVMAFRAELP